MYAQTMVKKQVARKRHDRSNAMNYMYYRDAQNAYWRRAMYECVELLKLAVCADQLVIVDT